MALGGCSSSPSAPRKRARLNTLRKVRLCLYSVERLNEVVADTGVEYDGLAKGNLYLYRSERSLEKGIAHTAILREQGVELRVLDRDAVAGVEPALAPVKDRLAGGLHAPGDQSGDARMFSRNLAAWCAGHLGVRFEYETRVRAIVAGGDRIERVETDRGERVADAFVLAAGHEAPFLAAPIGVKLPIWPCKGYSVTVPVGPSNLSPKIGMVDEDHLVAFCPMGRRLRVTSTAEFSGYDRSHAAEDFRAMFGRGAGALSGRRRLRKSRVLGGTSADDPHHRPDLRLRPLPQPDAQRRPRTHRLDDVVRLGEGGRRSARGA